MANFNSDTERVSWDDIKNSPTLYARFLPMNWSAGHWYHWDNMSPAQRKLVREVSEQWLLYAEDTKLRLAGIEVPERTYEIPKHWPFRQPKKLELTEIMPHLKRR